jgi:hypothetical protein
MKAAFNFREGVPFAACTPYFIHVEDVTQPGA